MLPRIKRGNAVGDRAVGAVRDTFDEVLDTAQGR
jgi:hypothetical protein